MSFYLVGVYFSLNAKFLKNKINPMILCMTFLFLSYFVYKNEMNIVLSIIVHILNVLCIWYASVLIPDLYPLGLDISFLIYETHEIIFSIVFKFLYIVLSKTILCGIINYILMLFFGFIITYIIFNMVKKINSKVYYFIGGK